MVGGESRAKEDRDQQRGTGRCGPCAIEPSTARRLMIGDQHDPLGDTLPSQFEQILIGGTGLGGPADVVEPGTRNR